MTLDARMMRIAVQLGLGVFLILGGWVAGALIVRAVGWAFLVYGAGQSVPVLRALGLLPEGSVAPARWGLMALTVIVALSLISSGIDAVRAPTAPAAIWLWLFGMIAAAGVVAQAMLLFGLPGGVAEWRRSLMMMRPDWRLPLILFGFALVVPMLGPMGAAAGAIGVGIALLWDVVDPIWVALSGAIRRRGAADPRNAEAREVLAGLPGVADVERCALVEREEQIILTADLAVTAQSWAEALAIDTQITQIMREAGVEQTRLSLAPVIGG